MKPEEDIGSLIKSKLQSVERASNEPTWERVQNSLEKRRKKRRFAFYIKLGTIGILLILSALFLYNNRINIENTLVSQEEISSDSDHRNNSSTEKNEDRINTNSQTTSDVVVNSVKSKANEVTDQNTVKIDTTTVNAIDTYTKTKSDRIKSKQQKQVIPMTFKNKKRESQITIINETKNIKDLDTVINRNDVLVTQTTQKVYYYYNSKNGQEMSSTSKKVIDSIIEANKKKQDSL